MVLAALASGAIQQFAPAPVRFLLGDPTVLTSALFGHGPAYERYMASVGTPAMLDYLTPSAQIRGAAKQRGERGLLSGGHVSGGLLRVPGQSFLNRPPGSVSGVLGPRGSDFSP